MENKKTILVVDDYRINTILLKQMLLTTPYTVVAAESGSQAIEILGKDHIDLVLLDIMMPVVNGFEVLAFMRNTPATKDIPVIITSAFSSQYDEELAMSKGANDYLPKPINNADLIEMVNKYLG